MIKTYFILNAIFYWFLTLGRKLRGTARLPKLVTTSCLLVSFGLLFQSCVPNGDVQPVQASNSVTVKVHNKSAATTRHLLIMGQKGVIILSKDITGDFSYSFNTDVKNLTVSASLTSETPFISSLQIDANHSMQAYHAASCADKVFDISKEIIF